ncbi:hypothetical protein [Shewanella sp. WPAGA9]|uniref:hypothetical protein n=1 Tax=Shewanella sp. ENK2 TaxID=2775245 RepID=UPI0017816AA7|nr:hypothetical protein [Shewanella sp. WPAGA9]
MKSVNFAWLILIALLLMSGSIQANVFNTQISIQCNHCRTDADFHHAALNALQDREQKQIDVVNFSHFEVRRFDVKKLEVEVCSDYRRSATKGYCELSDYSTIKRLTLPHIVREQYIVLAEYLLQHDFFSPFNIQVDPNLVASAWTLLQDKYQAQVVKMWQQDASFTSLYQRWQAGKFMTNQMGFTFKHLSPNMVFHFADQSRFDAIIDTQAINATGGDEAAITAAEVTRLGVDNILNVEFTYLNDRHANHLDATQAEPLDDGDLWSFRSADDADFIAMKQKAAQLSLQVLQQDTATGIKVNLSACKADSRPCNQ